METTEAIWAVSDGRAGLANQVLGLAEALARVSPRPVEVKTADFYVPWRALPPGILAGRLFGPAWLTLGSNAFGPPWPRLFIGCGRAAIVLSLYLRRVGAKTFRVQTQDPRISPANFDLVVPPLHDNLSGSNVLPILGSPNRITREALTQAAQKFAARYERLPRPRVAVLIGGFTRGHELAPAHIDRLAQTLLGLTKSGASLMITVSRRTGEENAARLRAALAGAPADFADGAGDNPYLGILALADYLLVTEDSTNMATEAAATGKPVYILPLAGVRPKQARLHAELAERGIARAFEGKLDVFTYTPLDETASAAAEICDRAQLKPASDVPPPLAGGG
jgi:mitochondrial fission protein ELM1